MIYDSWFFVAFGAGLLYLFLHRDKVRDGGALNFAWLAYIAALIPNVLITLFEARERICLGAAWACMVVSGLFLFKALQARTA